MIGFCEHNEKNKVEVQSRKVKSSLNKRNFDSKNVCNEHVKHPVKDAQALCSVCNECLFDANHAMCLIDHVNSMNVRAKSASKKNKRENNGNLQEKCLTLLDINGNPLEGLSPTRSKPSSFCTFVSPSRHEWDLVFQSVFDELFSPPTSIASPILVEEAPAPVESTGSPSSTTIDQDAPSPNMEDDVDISALTMEQYIALIPDDIKPGIVNPKIGDDVEFEINANFMRELRRKLFTGTDDEDAYEHVRTVLEIVDLFHFPGVTHDAIMLRVFPITLKGRALRWKNRLPVGTITTWDLLKKEFIWRYCHPFITAKKLEEIRNFKQERDETLYHAWERYNDLLYQCPLHDLNCQQKVHIFYTGLDISTRKILDSNGFIPLMTPTQALESIQVMADHSHDWYDETTTRERINDVLDNVDAIHKSFKGEHLTKEYPLKKEEEAIKHSKYMESLEETDDDGDMDVGWDITSKDVERLRQFLTPTIHTLPNLEPVVQPYIPLGPVHDMDKIVKEKKQDYDIPLNYSVMQPLTPHTGHITPPDDDYVAPTTNPMSNKIQKLRGNYQDRLDSYSFGNRVEFAEIVA
ncbi:reverse transcriptase domain-containing protein [Tanacetum coccineum]